MRVYVAASSDELDRAEWAMRSVESLGHVVALDWVKAIRAQPGGVANPTNVPREQRAKWSRATVDAINISHVLWLLAPNKGHGRGAFVEIGLALQQECSIVVSGPQHACSIFTALVTAELDTDQDALMLIKRWGDEHAERPVAVGPALLVAPPVGAVVLTRDDVRAAAADVMRQLDEPTQLDLRVKDAMVRP